MKRCTKIDSMTCLEENKPLVSILLAVYKPDKNWFIEQLISLNEQTYGNVELLVYDDCPEIPTSDEYFTKYITKFKYTLIKGDKNRGSNKAFEKLTRIANGELLAFCDQDDIWEKEKITLMVDKFKGKDITLVCSDLSIIDENGEKTADSITEIRKRIVYKSGDNLAGELLMTNFVTGCAMMVKKDIASKAIPFEKTLVHDQWIAIIAALNGKIEFINKPLVRYRQHGCNQTGILKDIYDKKTYYSKRILDFLCRYRAFKERLKYAEIEEQINNCLMWLEARKRYFSNPNIRDLRIMIKYKKFHKVSVLLEIILPFLPEHIFKFIINMAKKGML
ncbi:glycosyltransferase [Clostridium beijerinckii]|uniref:Glycosyltransferase n=1 Tax=Clostridium beijerinckii TaxID=1520 RepID=A0A7X9SM85_CLOBE|nr:glycosyltransferase [Clostridium beijerinckii]NMF04272.1 glycosyltransferase [Clostridium beijerinckii]